MSWVRVAVVSEHWQPLKPNLTIECFDVDDPNTVIATEEVDTGGVAIFTGLPSDQRFFFKPRISRYAGNYGGVPQPNQSGQHQQEVKGAQHDLSLYGEVKLQILGSPGVTCYDAVVEPTGQFGTHTTIQGAINAFATGDIGGTRPAFIAVKPAGDLTTSRYAEALTFTSTRRYVLHGCAQAQGWHGSEAADSAGLTAPAVIVRSPAAATRTVSTTGAGAGQLEMSGFLIEAPSAATVAYNFLASQIGRAA